MKYINLMVENNLDLAPIELKLSQEFLKEVTLELWIGNILILSSDPKVAIQAAVNEIRDRYLELANRFIEGGFPNAKVE